MDLTQETTQALQDAILHHLDAAKTAFLRDYAGELDDPVYGPCEWPTIGHYESINAWHEATAEHCDYLIRLINHFSGDWHESARCLRDAIANLQALTRRLYPRCYWPRQNDTSPQLHAALLAYYNQ